MKILTPDNCSYNLNKVPELVDDLQYCVLDTTNPKNIDFFFIPLIFLESFNAPSMVLEVNGINIQMPIDWSIMLTTGLIKSAEVKVVNVFQEVKWYFPKLKFGHIISVPLGDGENPDCLYFAKDINQLPDTMDVGSFF
jgi:hypothetical protein